MRESKGPYRSAPLKGGEGDHVESSLHASRLARTKLSVVALAAFAILVAACGGGGTAGASPTTAATTAGAATTTAATAKAPGTGAPLLPEEQTAKYEAADRPLFEAKVKAGRARRPTLYSNAAERAPT